MQIVLVRSNGSSGARAAAGMQRLAGRRQLFDHPRGRPPAAQPQRMALPLVLEVGRFGIGLIQAVVPPATQKGKGELLLPLDWGWWGGQ